MSAKILSFHSPGGVSCSSGIQHPRTCRQGTEERCVAVEHRRRHTFPKGFHRTSLELVVLLVIPSTRKKMSYIGTSKCSPLQVNMRHSFISADLTAITRAQEEISPQPYPQRGTVVSHRIYVMIHGIGPVSFPTGLMLPAITS